VERADQLSLCWIAASTTSPSPGGHRRGPMPQHRHPLASAPVGGQSEPPDRRSLHSGPSPETKTKNFNIFYFLFFNFEQSS